MIPLLLKALEPQFPGATLKAALLGGGVYRNPETYRSVALVYADGVPRAVARWGMRESDRLPAEHKLLTALSATGLNVPRPLALCSVDGRKVLVEEVLPGQSLQVQLARQAMSVDEALTCARNLLEDLQQKTAGPSTLESLAEEFRQVSLFVAQTGIATADLHDKFADDLNVLKTELGRAPLRLLVHGDYCLKNILCSGSQLGLIDFEFSAESHFVFVDWLRLFRYSSGLQLEEVLDEELPRLLKPLFATPAAQRAVFGIFEVADLRIRLQVFPNFAHDDMIAETKERFNALLSAGVSDYLKLTQRQRAADSEEVVADILLASQEARRVLSAEVARLRARYEQASLMLAQRNQETNQLRLRVAELEEAQARISAAEVESLRTRVQDLENILTHKDELLQSLIHSVSFRLGSSLSNAVRRFPGAGAVKRVLRN